MSNIKFNVIIACKESEIVCRPFRRVSFPLQVLLYSITCVFCEQTKRNHLSSILLSEPSSLRS